MKRLSQSGFTLIELMIVVVIVGALLLVAVPLYQEQMIKTRRTDAMSALMDLASRQEKFLLDRSVYTLDLASLNASSVSPEGWYDISIQSETGACPDEWCYELLAVPATGSPQAADEKCTSFTLDSSGDKGATGSLSDECW